LLNCTDNFLVVKTLTVSARLGPASTRPELEALDGFAKEAIGIHWKRSLRCYLSFSTV